MVCLVKNVLGSLGDFLSKVVSKLYVANQTIRQTDRLCGYSGERANNRGDSTIKEEVRRRKIRKFTIKQAKNNQADRRFKD